MQTNIFTPKVDQICDDPKESLLVVKIIIFEKWPQVTRLYEFNVKK